MKKVKTPTAKTKTETPAPAAKTGPGRKPRRPRKKAASPAVKKAAKRTGPAKSSKAPGLVGRKSDLLRMGQGSFLFAQQLSEQIEDLERQVAGYQRVFEVLQQLFSREMEELEDWVLKLLK